MAIQVNVHEAKSTLSKLLELAEAGEDVIIARAGKPVVRLAVVGSQTRKRAIGADAGKIWMSEDCFAPMGEEEFEDWVR